MATFQQGVGRVWANGNNPTRGWWILSTWQHSNKGLVDFVHMATSPLGVGGFWCWESAGDGLVDFRVWCVLGLGDARVQGQNAPTHEIRSLGGFWFLECARARGCTCAQAKCVHS